MNTAKEPTTWTACTGDSAALFMICVSTDVVVVYMISVSQHADSLPRAVLIYQQDITNGLAPVPFYLFYLTCFQFLATFNKKIASIML